ncbi:RagB/SusD family nutrient uptake outer membrane protein [Aestuariibaculum suncheonense]|uniref:RagB/SusD family nutrient uptake outer membrane protein n=1 Tax=Aestuariibaculum suncheonense TaxID=1028745 RepID=A0A8J6UKD8_9FLAO|nr:RagB/SusD family nutrient uptake outer membrane protein [Aestuariibaculum suncheonense]MBD0835621.1 RagB/SusD family nutrient uptake outer membrane protein [Aestuariibaculum suncheonense]
MKNIKLNIILLMVLITWSCSDDFVDVASQDTNSEDFFNTEKDYQDALVAAYDYLQATARNVQLGEIASDNTLCGGESATDVIGFQEIDDMIHTPINSNLREIWTWMYTGVNRANYIMEFQDKLDFSSKTSVIAQTRFLRAYYYFELVKWFGDVPLAIDKRIQFGEQFSIDRAPKSDVYALIEDDLKFAADNLPYTQSETGRVTKGAAQALLGKAYLYQDKFSEAAAVLEDLIEKGPYRLLTSEEAPLMFENEYENNIESVFEIQYSDVDGGSYDCFQCLEGNYAVGFNGVRSYDGPLYDFGYSFNVPTQEVVDAFEEGDIRLGYSILDIEAWAEETGATYATGYEHTGYFNLKYIARKGDLNQPDAALTNPNNYRSIRFADVLLMAAEALNRGSISDTRAAEYLNMVRTRATLAPVSISGSNLTNAIYKERRVELVGEGHRFFDLVRTGRAAQEIDGFVSGKHEVFPIPVEEIELSGGRWNQNPGY